MKRMFKIAGICAGMLAVTPGGLAAAEGFSPIQVRLVSDARGIVPGREFSVGIHQKMLPGYHTYWRNAGTLGMPTAIDWELPEGFSAGALQWPIPRVTRMARYQVWGYEGEALLLTTMKAPESLKAGDVIELKGTARWMCCGRQCLPAAETLSISLPVRAEPEPDEDWVKAFDRVRSEQPRLIPGWELSCSFAKETYRLILTPKKGAGVDPGDVRFFGYDRQVSSDKEQKLRRSRKRLTLTLRAEEFSWVRGERLRGIVVGEKEWGRGLGRVMEVDVPVTEGR